MKNKSLGLRYWFVRKGTTRMRVRAESIVEAEHKARDYGLRNPDAIGLEESEAERDAARAKCVELAK